MTEAEWNACTDPFQMLAFLRGKTSDRKLRLFAVACCRPVLASRLSVDNDLYDALAMAESLADGLVDQQEALRVRSQLESISPYSEKWSASGAVRATLDTQASLAAEGAARHSVNHFGSSKQEPRSFLGRMLRPAPGKPGFQPCDILRDLFANPFRPIVLSPTCLTPPVKHLAQVIYAERSFETMPALGDALEKAGCDNADILNHCRLPEKHYRGCWVTDAVLGKG